MGQNKYFANFGVERNKKPLQNIVYKIELRQPQDFKTFEEIVNIIEKVF